MRDTILIILFFVSAMCLHGQPTLFETLPDTGVYKVKIETDFKGLIKKKMDPTYQEANLTFMSGPLEGKTYPVEIRSRGNIRKEICYYPPVKIKFKKADFKHNKIKWVNICRNTEPMRDVLLKEYLTYQIYQEISEMSLGVRLFEVEYVDGKNDKSLLSSYGFMIEPIDELADRAEAKEYEPRIMRPRILDRYHYPLVSMFQYLVGNTDWAIDNLHNLKFLRSTNFQGVIPIPYDFDYSGFVGAPYAVPHESLPIKNVRNRYNKGHCITESELEAVLEVVLDKKDEVINTIRDFSLMQPRTRDKLTDFMERGYEDLENAKVVKRIFVKNCDMCPVN